MFSEDGDYPYFTRTVFNNGILGNVDYFDEEHLISGNSLPVGMIAMRFFYLAHDFYAGQYTKTALPNSVVLNKKTAMYFLTCLNRFSKLYQSSLVRDFAPTFEKQTILLPATKEGEVDYEWMESFIIALQRVIIRQVAAFADERISATKQTVSER